ncbi:MAG: DUF4395 domain-containing protein [Bacteroidota bacterium]|nr:DUF4395 domain-containing protein [Bacteroidota bacterium]
MKKGNNVIKFGEDVEGYTVPVLNEREIRASAGILFVGLFISLMLILFKQDFLLVKYVIVVFLTDFIIRVFVSPKFSPTLIIGRLIVSRQVPEYVGAPPKKFAWKIGLALSGLMFFLLNILNSYSIITAVTCFICLIFLFFESAFGICLGCLFYGLFYKDEAQYCAGEVCEVTKKQAIQNTSWVQLLIVFGSVVYVLLAVLFFNDHFRVAPRNLKEIINSL